MSATDDMATRRSAKDKPGKGEAPEKGDRARDGGQHPPGGLGRALKTVYDDTLREEVPKDFLDLLGKLS